MRASGARRGAAQVALFTEQDTPRAPHTDRPEVHLMLSQPALPSWAALAALVPSSTVKRPISTDWILTPDHDSLQSSGRLTLFRERNGWCPYSARLWLALELKELDYDTVRIDTSFNGRPSFLSDATPQIQWPGAVQDGTWTSCLPLMQGTRTHHSAQFQAFRARPLSS